ncbi:carbohydrate-binding module family 13 protein [Rhizophagus irregularis DAOM 181602=DAOM 197198]|nr:carbohydrate-binding module family 13 protein [Rhizophagus irregularis DAOM 181602=DAOM 197198]
MIGDKLLPKLSQNLLEILNDEEYYDITIEVEIFGIILRYIYGGKISLEEYNISDIVKIMIAAKELSLKELISYLESFLIEYKANWLEQNFDLIYQISFEDNTFLELQKYCEVLISKEPNKIFNSPNFPSISEKLLITLIQNDNFQMNEIQVWEHVIKWGLAQNPELSSDLISLSKDNFDTLRNTLQQCIPYIRFRNLTSKEFLHNIFPFREILPKKLYVELLKFFLNSNYRPSEKFSSESVDSVIISNQHVELISKWINKTGELSSSCKFKLLYRDSRDRPSELNSNFNKFREICKNKSRTVVVSKVRDSNKILGGYNPIVWKFIYGTYGSTKDSFIFSFDNNNIGNYILSRVKEEKKAIYNGSCSIGPSFNNDLYLYKDIFNQLRICCKQCSYEKHIGEINHLYIEEFEVFQIV